MGIFRTNDPTQYAQVDGIVIDERAAPMPIKGQAQNVVGLIGQFERGPVNQIIEVGSTQEFYQKFGKSGPGNVALANKVFGRLRICRVGAAGQLAASLNLQHAAATVAVLNAKYPGAYGNSIQATVAAGSTSGFKLTLHDANTGAVLPDEVYDNLTLAGLSAALVNSQLVSVSGITGATNPDNSAASNLAGGSDGAPGDSDYSTAIDVWNTPGSCNILISDNYTAAIKAALKTHVSATEDKIAIICGAQTDDKAAVATDAALYRSDRIIYAFPWVQTTIAGVPTMVKPTSFVAAVLANTGPHVDPASVDNIGFLAGIDSLVYPSLSRSDYISLLNAGVCSFELDPDFGIKIKSGITTNLQLPTILRRRMADFLQNSAGQFLKTYQNKVNSKKNRASVKASILGFVRSLQKDGMLPTDDELNGAGAVTLVDIDSLNTPDTLAQGLFKIIWRQRIFSSMRYIVLLTEIGESVVVTDVSGS